MPIDPDIVEHIKEIGTKRSTYSTRQMAAQISRETGILTNRKKNTANIPKNRWTAPQKTK